MALSPTRALARSERPADEAEPTKMFHVACCLDGSAGSLASLAETRRLASLMAGRVSAVHLTSWSWVTVASPEGGCCVPDPEMLVEGARAWLAEQLSPAAREEGVVLLGDPATALCRWADHARPDLILLWEPAGRLARLLRGRPGSYVTKHAPCPVIVMREGRSRRSAPPAHEPRCADGACSRA